MPTLYVEKMFDDAKLPVRATTHAACQDVHIYLKPDTIVKGFTNNNIQFDEIINVGQSNMFLAPGSRILAPTGLKMACDIGYKISAYPRSGLSFKQGVNIINCVGVIDADYRKQFFFLLFNNTDVPIRLRDGDRIGQIEVNKVEETCMVEGQLPAIQTTRTGGIGSTDV